MSIVHTNSGELVVPSCARVGLHPEGNHNVLEPRCTHVLSSVCDKTKKHDKSDARCIDCVQQMTFLAQIAELLKERRLSLRVRTANPHSDEKASSCAMHLVHQLVTVAQIVPSPLAE